MPREYTVKVGAVGNGSVTSDRVGSINYFDVRTYLFTPDIGYAVKDVRVNGVSVGAVSSFTYTDVQSDQTLEVEFEADKRDISLSVAGKGSIRSNKSLVDVPFGEDRSISFVADDGWKLECVFLDGIRVDLSDNEVLIENITDDMDLFAIFVQAENENNIGLVAAIIAVSSLAVIASVTSVIFIIKLRKISLRSKK